MANAPKTMKCPGPVSRRSFLKVGSLALGGMTLPQMFEARATSGQSSLPDTSVILLYLHGGPSQLETYDLKPNAPTEYRSIFQPISTNVPGMDICELFPLQAQMADKFSIVRSLNHDVSIHSDGGIVVLTGKRPEKLDPASQSKSEHPEFGAIASKLRGIGANGIPPYVAMPGRPYMVRPNYLGTQHSPLELGDPSSKSYRPPQLSLSAGGADGLTSRHKLLTKLDSLRADLDFSGSMQGTDDFRQLAFQMLTSPQAAKAFAIDDENDDLRDRYGRNFWGQGCLLARRLAEAGTAVVSLMFNTPHNGDDFTNWDDHIGNAGRPGHFGKYMRVRLPYFDQAISALIDDIHTKGLDQKIMVVAVGEFGRTPRLSVNNDGTGRNHWPQAYSALFSGGGLKMGQVVGATNSKAEFPTERPYTPYDMLATIYRHLGIDYTRAFTDYSGRPVHILSQATPIPELI